MSVDYEVREILQAEFGLDASNLNGKESIFESGLLDSLSSLKLLMVLETKFGLSISPLDISLEDVDSIEKITATVNRLQS